VEQGFGQQRFRTDALLSFGQIRKSMLIP